MSDALLVGTAEVDITPPVGTEMAGGLNPRKSEGIQDPLYAKAIVLESQGTKIAYVLLDLIALYREDGDKAVELASRATGIPPDHIVWAASHTHTGPYPCPVFGSDEPMKEIDREWLASVPGNFAEAVRKAHESRVPARMSRHRAYHIGLAHNRRLRFKDGREINTWLLESGEEDMQCLGAAGPVDPEIGILAFEAENGQLLAVLFQYTLHANTNFGRYFSADYPAVVASRLREAFGVQVSTLYVPGACADLNSAGYGYRQVGDALADRIIGKIKARKAPTSSVRLGACKREVTVGYRDLTVDQEKRIRDSQWPPEGQEVFRQELEIMRKQGITSCRTILQAWHIGEVAFASLPGELFLGWGLKIKEESPFPWTYPVELGGDYVGYLITHQAWKAGGYEALIARSAKPTPEAVEDMVNQSLEMLRDLYAAYRR